MRQRWHSAILLILIMLGAAIPTAAQNQSTDIPAFNQLDNPLFAVASYYNAINRGEYPRAYDYWRGNAPSGATLNQFTQGFAQTQSVQALVRLPITYDTTAGSIYAEMPIILISTQRNGTQQIFGGCFVTRKSNVPAGNATEPDPNWYLYSATFSAIDAVDFSLAVPACSTVESFPLSSAFTTLTSPPDLLTAYYDAIARGDFARAYSYWGGNLTNQTLAQFTQGFNGTSNIGVVVDLSVKAEGAAGSIYDEMPVMLLATQNRTQQYFVGCYTLRKSNVPVGNATEPDPNWQLYRANNAPVATLTEGLQELKQVCARG